MATNPIAIGQSLPTTIAPATAASGAASSAANATTINTAVTAVGLTGVNPGSQSPSTSNPGGQQSQQNSNGPSGYLLQAFGTALLQSGVSLFGPAPKASSTTSSAVPITSAVSALTQALPSATQSSASANSSVASAAAPQATGTLPIRDAVHKFMHDLMTAVSAQQTGATGSASSSGIASSVSAAGYTNMSSVLSGLIAQLTGPAVGHATGGVSPNSLLSTLQTDFQQIVAASGGASTSPTAPSFDSFLQNLQYTISALGQASPSSTGSLINVTA